MNTLQENNKNVLSITNDLKVLSKRIVAGEGTLGKLLNDDKLYNNINATTVSLQQASAKAHQMTIAMAEYTSKLNKKGTLASDLVNDTIVFRSLRTSILKLQKVADTASAFITNLKEASSNVNTPVGVLLHDEKAGSELKSVIKNLDSSSVKLDEDLEALQHNFLLKKYFKKKAKGKL